MEIQLIMSVPDLTGTGQTHTSTEWVVSTNPDMSITDDYVLVHTSTTDLVSNILELDFTGGKVYYFRSRYILNNSINSEWSTIVKLDGNFCNMKSSNVLIMTPIVKANVSYENSDNGLLIIDTSDMYTFTGVGDGEHRSTSYRIQDDAGNTIWERRYDRTNLTNIKIPNKYFKPNRVYNIQAKYHIDADNESLWGGYLYTPSATIPYYTLTPVCPISTEENDILFVLRINTPSYSSIDLIIKDDNGLVVASKLNQTTYTPTITIPAVPPNTVYRVYSRITFTTGTKTEYIESYSFKGTTFGSPIPSITYLNKYDYVQQVDLGTPIYGMSFTTCNNKILLSRLVGGIYRLSLYEINGGYLTLNRDVYYDDPTVFDLQTSFVTATPNNKILINCTTGDADGYKAKFVLLRYGDSFVVEDEVTLTDEIGGIGVSGSGGFVNNTQFYYIPNTIYTTDTQLLELRALDTTTMTVTTVSALPTPLYKYTSLVVIDNDNLLLIGGSSNPTDPDWNRTNNDIYKYNISTDTWTIIATFDPGVWSEAIYNQHCIKRGDGQIVIFNGALDLDTINQSVCLLNTTNNTLTYKEMNIPDTRRYVYTVQTSYGDIFRISSITGDLQSVYTYVSNTLTDAEITYGTDSGVDSIFGFDSGDNILGTFDTPFGDNSELIPEPVTMFGFGTGDETIGAFGVPFK